MKLITIISGIILLILFINTRIRSKRKSLSFDLRIIYDRLEMSIIKNAVNPDNLLIKYLKGFKNLAVNPSLADIQVILGTIAKVDKSKLEQMRKEMDDFETTLPKETLELANQFNSIVNSMVKLSMYKVDFILFLIWIIPPILIHKGIEGIRDVASRYIANIKNEVAIVSYGKFAVC